VQSRMPTPSSDPRGRTAAGPSRPGERPATGADRPATALRWLAAVVALLITAAVVRVTIVALEDTRAVNDLEAYHHVGEQTARGSIAIYEHVSPVRLLGPFLYPPSSAVLFVPLGWAPYDALPIPWTVLKLAALGVLFWGAIRFSGAPPVDAVGWVFAIGLVLLPIHRLLDSDMKNGQVNLFVALCAAGGGWLLISRGPWRWLGGVVLGVGAALKLTPALILALPVVHRRWGLAAASAALLAGIVIGLPVAWFGWSATVDLHERYGEVMRPYLIEARDGPRQATLNELAQFTITSLAASDEARAAVRADPPPLGPRRPQDTRLPPVTSPEAARAIWFALGLATGLGYLLVRRTVFRARTADWTWDLAVLCTCMVMLSPQVRKAHLVVLIVPLAWTACRWLELGRRHGSLLPPMRRRPVAAGCALAAVACLMASDDLVVRLPGFPLPHRPALLLGMGLLLTAMTRLVATWPSADDASAAPATARTLADGSTGGLNVEASGKAGDGMGGEAGDGTGEPGAEPARPPVLADAAGAGRA